MNYIYSQKSIQNNVFFKSDALQTGLHIGHKSLRLSKNNFWHPLMAQYFLGIRYRVAFIDPVQTQKSVLRAFYIIALVLKTKTMIHSSTKKSDISYKGKNQLNSERANFFSNTKQLFLNSNPIYNKQNLKKNIQNKNTRLNDSRLPIKSTNNLLFMNSSKTTTSSENKNTFSFGHVLIINTNPEFYHLYNNFSQLTLHNLKLKKPWYSTFLKVKSECFSYVHYKWVGGTLTNYKQISKSLLTYAKFAERCEKFLFKNNIDFPRYKKIKECFNGLIRKKSNRVYLSFHEKPDLLFLMNPNENRHIIAEANKMHIPVIALVESNTCLKGISYPIPVNAYSVFFLYYCLKKMIKLSIK